MALPRTDTFGSAVGPLDSTWTQQAAAGNVNYDGFGSAVAGVRDADIAAFDNQNTYSNDQYSKVTVGANGGGDQLHYVCLTTRASGTGGTEQSYKLKSDGGSGAGSFELWRVVSGAQTLLRNYTATTVAGDIIELRSIGTVHEVFKNSVSLGTQSDSNIVSGSAGVAFYDSSAAGTRPKINDWEGGNLGGIVVGWSANRRIGQGKGPYDRQGFVRRAQWASLIGPVDGSVTVVTDVGSLILTGVAPTLGLEIPTSVASLTLVGISPILDLKLVTNVGSLVLTGTSPVLDSGIKTNPGLLTLSGFSPLLNLTIPTATGVLTLSGFAPSLGLTVPTSVGQLILSGAPPSLDQLLATGVGSLILTGFVPTISNGIPTVTGVTRDNTGARLGSCVIHVFRASDDVRIASGTSNASGDFSIAVVNGTDLLYLVAYKAGAPDVAGTTQNTITGV